MGATALTTGANAGIGLATAVELARGGWRSVGTVRSEAKAETVRQAADAAGVDVETVLLDVTDADRCAEVIDDVRPEALVNNAGIPVTGALEDVDEDTARLAFETMTIAPIRLARLALPHMRASGRGRIVNVSSIYGRITTPLNGWYQAAKHALEAATDALRVEIARDNVRVVLVEPGLIRTGLVDEARDTMQEREDSPYYAAYARSVAPLELLEVIVNDPEDVARTIVRAVGSRVPRSRYLVGVDARVAALAQRTVPTAVWDRVARIVLGL